MSFLGRYKAMVALALMMLERLLQGRRRSFAVDLSWSFMRCIPKCFAGSWTNQTLQRGLVGGIIMVSEIDWSALHRMVLLST